VSEVVAALSRDLSYFYKS